MAVEYALGHGLDWIFGRIQRLAAFLRAELRRLPGVAVHDHGRLLCGIVSFSKVGVRLAKLPELFEGWERLQSPASCVDTTDCPYNSARG